MIPFQKFTFIVVNLCLFSLVTVCFALDNNDKPLNDSTFGEMGRQRLTRSSDEEELEEICGCLVGKSYPKGASYCFDKFRDYGPIIREGTCFGNLSTRNKRRLKRSDAAFISPPTFIENKKCRGTKSIILASSGKERHLTLTTKASVFICKGSIDPNLQKLFVTGVSKIVIAKGALKERDSHLEIRFSSVEEKIIIPEEAFSVPITLEGSIDSQTEEADSSLVPPPSIKLEIDTANDAELRSRSIMAPIVQVRLNQVKNVRFCSNSVIPLAHPEASTLEVSHCHSVTMDTHTTHTGKFEAKHINHLLMKEKAVEVVADNGAGARIEYVSNITLLDDALSIGSGADILLNNLTFTSAGVRAIQGTGPGNLRRAAFTYVTGKQLASVAMCIKAETAVVYNVEIRGNNDSHVGSCIEGQMVHQSDNAGVTVICQKSEWSSYLCDDPRCSLCAFDSKEAVVGNYEESSFAYKQRDNTTAVPHVPVTHTAASAVSFSTQFSYIRFITEFVTTMASSSLTENATNYLSAPTTNSSTDETAAILPVNSQEGDINITVDDSPINSHSYSQPPVYVIVLIVCAIIFLAFIAFMIYRCCTRSKHDKYYLPQENRLSSFHNPRTIMTPENLASYGDAMQRTHSNTPEVFTAYDGYRLPNVAYIPASQPIATSNSSRLELHSPPPAYEPPDSGSLEMPPPSYNNEGFCPDSGNGLQTENLISPPPEGYSHTSDEQITSRLSLSSESTSSAASNSDDDLCIPGNYLPSPDGNLNVPTENHIAIISISQQCHDKEVMDEQQQILGNKFYI